MVATFPEVPASYRPTGSAVVVIPARLGSTRFPEKVIAADTGRPMVQHVVDRVTGIEGVGAVLVATDSTRVADALRPFGTHVVLTSPDHPSGTDRVAEVMRGRQEPIIVNVQADEPEIDPATVQALIRRLRETSDGMATAATPFPSHADPHDPNLVKVVTGLDGRALYFSRGPVPFGRDVPPGDVPLRLHLGVYAYRRDVLLRLASLSPTPLEKLEKLEQLRALEHGIGVGVIDTVCSTHGIDTPEQYAEFVRRRESAACPDRESPFP